MTAPGFRSPRTLAKISIALLGVVLVLDLAQTGSFLLQYELLERAARGVEISAAEASFNDQRVSALAALYSLAFFGSAIAFLVWFHRLYQNLSFLVDERLASSFADARLEHTPGWAVGAWFVPFLNLFVPYQIMREAWSHNASTREAGQGSLVGWWWGMYIVFSISGWSAVMSTRTLNQSVSDLITMTWLQIVHSLLGVAAAMLAILVVRRQSEMQIARANGGAVADGVRLRAMG